MLEFLNNYSGNIFINDEKIGDNQKFSDKFSKLSGKIHIKLMPENCISIESEDNNKINTEYIFYVKSWMLEKSTPDFNFMQVWNNDIPMPLRYMIGTVEKQTSRMYYTKLHGYIPKTQTCTRCGRTLINPVSKLLGIGPECVHHFGLNNNIFLDNNISKETICRIQNNLQNITWEGWIPKTAVLLIQQT